jgi:hypothetical protein
VGMILSPASQAQRFACGLTPGSATPRQGLHSLRLLAQACRESSQIFQQHQPKTPARQLAQVAKLRYKRTRANCLSIAVDD